MSLSLPLSVVLAAAASATAALLRELPRNQLSEKAATAKALEVKPLFEGSLQNFKQGDSCLAATVEVVVPTLEYVPVTVPRRGVSIMMCST